MSLDFKLTSTIGSLLCAGLLSMIYLRAYRRIPFLEAFTTSEKRILSFQLLAISLWTILALGYTLYIPWSGFKFEFFTKGPGNINTIIAFVNWILWGFIAITSLFSGVSIVRSIRSWNLRDPAKGRESLVIGILLLSFLLFWTWMIFRPSL